MNLPQPVTAISTALLILLAAISNVPAQKLAPKGVAEGNPGLAKVAARLLQARRLAREGRTMRDIRGAMRLTPAPAEGVEVEIRLKTLTPALFERIVNLGVHSAKPYYPFARITGFVSLESLDEIAARPEVAAIHPNYGRRRRAGSVTSQGDNSIRAALARGGFLVNGSGVTVGVLSDSFNQTIGGFTSGTGCTRSVTGAGPQLSGDLPAAVTVLDNGPSGGVDEGAGLAELVFDIAPGVAISFHSADPDIATFAAGITALTGCGADVLLDDIIYLAEPMFQDGIIAQAAQQAVAAGVAFFSAAGNEGATGVYETFADVSPLNDAAFPVTGVDFHLFNGGDEFASVTLPAGCGVDLVLQWNDPFSGTLGTGAVTDLDLYVCDDTTAVSCTAISDTTQGTCAGAPSSDPLEIGFFFNDGTVARTYHVAVDHFCDADGVPPTNGLQFRMVPFPFAFNAACDTNDIDNIVYEANVFDKTTIYGHSAAAGVQATGAVFYREIDLSGDAQAPFGVINVEPYSSLGGEIPFFFDGAGSPLPGAPVFRFKPELTGPDGTNTSFFGSDDPADLDSFPNFFGTSAAAAHAAGAAALMLSSSPDLNPAGVTQVLAAAARNIELPGIDPLAGNGLVDAFDAVQTVTRDGMDCIAVLHLSSQTIEGSQYFRACDEITAGTDLLVAASAQLEFETTGIVGLRPGFAVAHGGRFSVNQVEQFGAPGP